MRNIFVLLFCLWVSATYSCDCPQLQRETMVSKGLKASNIVFFGELIKLDKVKETYSFRIIELFKGTYKSSIINGRRSNSNCSFLPYKKDLWIIYASLNQDKTINLSYCLPSQTTEIPVGILPPIPLIKTSDKITTKIDSLSNEIDNLKIRNETMSNWFYQLEQLRAYKLSRNADINKIKKNLNFKIVCISLIINGILFITLIFLLLRNKKAKNQPIL
ncbi:MAG: hypothetical protein Q7T12_08350 [Flavobacterium sp.]|nr:hypothetical protein [Flavobacterium sp.]